MNGFQLSNTTKIEFGAGILERVGEIVKGYGASRVLLHCDGGDVLGKTGVLGKVRTSLIEAGIFAEEVGGVESNPKLEKAKEAIALCKEKQIDFIVALGGGSTIDSAKCIALGAVYEGDVWDFYGEAPLSMPQRALPVAAVLTLPATGSESNNSSVITKEPDLKRAVDTEFVRPVVAFLDPTVTYTLPAFITAAGVVDMISHIMERYFVRGCGNELTDQLCEAAMRSGIYYGRKVLEEPDNYEIRANLMYLSTITNNGVLAAGRDMDLASHMIEHELSGEFNIVHGAGMAIVIPAWMEYVCREYPEIFIKYATHVWNIPYDFREPESVIPLGIEATRDFYREMGMPEKLHELVPEEKLTDDVLWKLAQRVRRYHKDGTVGSIMRLDTQELFEIMKAVV